MSSEKLTVYHSSLSSPSMFILMSYDYVKLNYKDYELNANKGEHKQPWYLELNKEGSYPIIKDIDGFITNEGIAIVRYGIESREIDTSIYPYNSNKKMTAKINEAIELISEDHVTPFLTSMRLLYFLPTFVGLPKPNPKMEMILKEIGHKCFRKFEEMLKNSSGDYFMGDQITLVDFYAMAFVIVPQELEIITIEKYERLRSWYEKLSKIDAVKKAIRNFNKKIEHETKPAPEKRSFFKSLFCSCFSSEK